MAKAKARPRGANKYTPPAKSSAPAWIWLVAGVVIGCFVMFLMKLEPKQDIRPKENKTTKVTPKDHTTDKPKFIFRDLLSGKETTASMPPVTPEKYNQIDGERAAALLDGKTPPPLPPIQQKPVTQPTTAAVATQTTTPRPATAPTVTPTPKPTQVATAAPVAAPTKMTFFLQVGAYPSKEGAESIRARLLMLGQDAKLETVSSNGKTWYRVLVGSFATKEAAVKNQTELSSQGFKQTRVIPRKIN